MFRGVLVFPRCVAWCFRGITNGFLVCFHGVLVGVFGGVVGVFVGFFRGVIVGVFEVFFVGFFEVLLFFSRCFRCVLWCFRGVFEVFSKSRFRRSGLFFFPWFCGVFSRRFVGVFDGLFGVPAKCFRCGFEDYPALPNKQAFGEDN